MTLERRKFLERAAGGMGFLAAVMMAGCSSTDEVNRTVSIESKASVPRVDSWWAGTVWEYKGAYVVEGTIENKHSKLIPMPTIEMYFYDSNGRVDTSNNLIFYTKDRVKLGSGPKSIPNSLNPGQRLIFKTVYKPENPLKRYKISIE